MPVMARAALVPLIALLLGACASEAPPADTSAETDQAIAALETRVDDLADDLSDQASDSSKLDKQLGALGERLDRAIERLQEALEGVRAGSQEATDQAASALANVSAVASDLSVLERRFEYHLRSGGGG
jgi:ABC-type transporter Mla subunit MlaD